MPTELQKETWLSRNFLLPLIAMVIYGVLLGLGRMTATVTSSWLTFLGSDKVFTGFFLGGCAGVYNVGDAIKTIAHLKWGSDKPPTNGEEGQ